MSPSKGDPHLLALLENVQNTILQVGKHVGRFVIRLLTCGLPFQFLKEKLFMTDKDCKKRRVGVKKPEDIDKSDLCGQNYSANTERSKITQTEVGLYARFFKASTAVFSGTDRRCVELTMKDWECKVPQTHRDHNQRSITINPRSHTS